MRKIYSSIYVITLLALISLPLMVKAQSDATFFEGFDNTPLGELPEGWTWYQEGGQDPLAHWSVSTHGMLGPKVAYSAIEGALEGMVDEDWLITPQITPVPGDFLIFDAAQTYVWFEYGTKYHVLISTTGTDPVDFADTLATYNEAEFPGYFETLSFDLVAYENTPIYIAFVHETSSTNGNQTDDWYLDNVFVRPIRPAELFRAEVNWQFAIPVPISSGVNTPLLGYNVRIAGDEGMANLSKLKFTTKGTSEDLDITEATLYTTYQTSLISYGDDGVHADVYGTVSNPSDTFEISGDQDLPVGDNYFWLTYTFKTDKQPEYPYPKADASLEGVWIDGTAYGSVEDTIVVSPPIVPDSIPNDHYADAIEISTSGRYGSYNNQASGEPEFESLAYCAPGGTSDTANSTWWYFTAPSDGWVTADLSDTNFDTILLFMDADSLQIGCNNDIEPGLNIQSRISDFPISAGEKIYIRVTGMGLPGDPNGEAGIIHMDFSFTSTVTGIDDTEGSSVMSYPYPNPSSGMTSLDIHPKNTRVVSVDILDLMGRPVERIYEGQVATDKKQTIDFDVSTLAAGVYMVQMKSSAGVEGMTRLVVTE